MWLCWTLGEEGELSRKAVKAKLMVTVKSSPAAEKEAGNIRVPHEHRLRQSSANCLARHTLAIVIVTATESARAVPTTERAM
ncbi:hypothetical protein GBAR_LOCUS20742 [Geodia barretti]|uniref:Uncharacterized protein n=1 Tax=Geodia barretti TaxID=519541 RepID=A0AA35WX40_GEOBA|nr:hypothetical protein GBAR_LOCUS20742 [Geodia barretti]